MISPFNRGTGLIIIEVRNSNPNGDPDQESDPRTLDVDGRGVITPVSFKRKLRDIVATNEEAMALARDQLKLPSKDNSNAYGILESRNRRRDEIKAMSAETFKKAYWDARVFGNTFLESLKEKDSSDNQNADNAKSKKDKGAAAEAK